MGNPLPDKYLNALVLIEQGDLSYKDIAKQVGLSADTLYELIEGKHEKHGQIGPEFGRLLSEIHKKRDREIRDLTKKNKKNTQYLIDRYLCDAKKRTKVSKPLVQTLTSIANALSKSTPKVEIGSLSYTQGISAEELAYEFKRLNAGSAGERPEGRTILETLGGGSTEVSLGEARIHQDSEEPEAPFVQAKSEA